MRIAVVWDWPIENYQAMTWRDGLAKAIQILRTRHQVSVFACGTRSELPHPYFPIYVRETGSELKEAVKAFIPDVILHWADTTRPNAAPLWELGRPQALCFAGGEPFGETYGYFDHIFVESQSYLDRFKERGVSVSTAFGTNEEIFKPNTGQKKHFDVCNFSTFAGWKRHELLIQSTLAIDPSLRMVCAGFQYQTHERECWEYPMKSGALVLPHLPAEVVSSLMDASKVCVLTSMASGGSQRTALEAMAKNIPLVVCDDSDKLVEYVREGGGFIADHNNPMDIHAKIVEAMNVKNWDTRSYIDSKWTAEHYANSLEAGLYDILQRKYSVVEGKEARPSKG